MAGLPAVPPTRTAVRAWSSAWARTSINRWSGATASATTPTCGRHGPTLLPLGPRRWPCPAVRRRVGRPPGPAAPVQRRRDDWRGGDGACGRAAGTAAWPGGVRRVRLRRRRAHWRREVGHSARRAGVPGARCGPGAAGQGRGRQRLVHPVRTGSRRPARAAQLDAAVDRRAPVEERISAVDQQRGRAPKLDCLGCLGGGDLSVLHLDVAPFGTGEGFVEATVGDTPVRAAVEVQKRHTHRRCALNRAQSRHIATPGVAARPATRPRGNTPPQQPQRRKPGTAANGAGRDNMHSCCLVSDPSCNPAHESFAGRSAPLRR